MSIWTSKSVAALAAVAALAGCAGGFNITRNAPEQIRLPDGLVVAGARGWCIDQTTTRTGGDASVVVLGSCAAIAQDALLPRPLVPGVVTVSVEDAATGVPPADTLEAFLVTAPGRAALARDGRATSVDILETRRSGETLYLHAVDRSGWPRSVAQDYWRALFDIDGRFVTVSLVGLSKTPISRDDGLATLDAQIERLVDVNSN